MNLLNDIIISYPELKEEDFYPSTGFIHIVDDSDGRGAYIAKWDYEKPIPAGLKLGKDQAQSPKKVLPRQN